MTTARRELEIERFFEQDPDVLELEAVNTLLPAIQKAIGDAYLAGWDDARERYSTERISG